MAVLWSLAWYIVAVGFLVIVHEFGHFWVARRLGFKVLRFSVGFGKPLARKVIGADRTELVLAPIPLGGYVKMLDEREGPVPSADLPRSFTHRPPWQRIVVLLAGPGFNVLFAILVLWGMLWVSGIDYVRPFIGEITAGSVAARGGLRSGDEILAIDGHATPDYRDVLFDVLDSILARGESQLAVRGSDGAERTVTLSVEDRDARRRLTEPPMLLDRLGFRFRELPIPPTLGAVAHDMPAERAGLRPGDRIVRLDDVPIHDWRDIQRVASSIPGKSVVVSYERGGAESSVRLTVSAEILNGHRVGLIGVRPQRASDIKYPDSVVRHTDLSALGALGAAGGEAWNLTAIQGRLVWRMILGEVSLKSLSGPIGIAQYAGESAEEGPSDFMRFLALISLAIALFNLLPIPILDGGQIVFQAAEWVKGKPLSERAQVFGQQVGIALLVLLVCVALFNDVSRQLG